MKYFILLTFILFSIQSAACGESEQFEYCIGDRVVGPSGQGATVVAKFPNGEISVVYLLSRPSKALPTSKFAVLHGCVDQDLFCAGDVAYTESGSKVKIGGIYQNGDVAVRFFLSPTLARIATSKLSLP